MTWCCARDYEVETDVRTRRCRAPSVSANRGNNYKQTMKYDSESGYDPTDHRPRHQRRNLFSTSSTTVPANLLAELNVSDREWITSLMEIVANAKNPLLDQEAPTVPSKKNENAPKPKPSHDGKIHRGTNLTRKTDARTGYKHGSANNAREPKKT